MKNTIAIEEDNKGFYAVYINGRNLAYGLTKEEAGWFYRGIMHGIEHVGQKVELDDSIFDVFHK